MIRVLLSGATGKVGQALVPAFESEPDIQLVARAAPSLGLDLAAGLAAGGVDVAVDFSVPEAAGPACRAAIAAGVPLVLGTSGLAESEHAAIDQLAREAGVPLFHAPNYAIGAVLMMRFAEQAHALMPAAHIIELHAEGKRDAPSGTAKATNQRMGGDVPISSVRLPGLVAHQEVILGGLGETLTIRNDTSSREAFVPGVLLAVRRVASLPPGMTVGLDALL